MEILEKIFGSAARAKILRLFVFNGDKTYDPEEIASRSKVELSAVHDEVASFERIGLIRKKLVYRDLEIKKGRKIMKVRRKIRGYTLDTNFPYLMPLQNFLVDVSPITQKNLAHMLNRVGKIKLVIVAGVFIHEPESRVDILIVGNDLRKSAFEGVIKTIESQLGVELKYAAFETDDFLYRLSMCDKLIRDILDYPHEKVVDRLAIDIK